MLSGGTITPISPRAQRLELHRTLSGQKMKGAGVSPRLYPQPVSDDSVLPSTAGIGDDHELLSARQYDADQLPARMAIPQWMKFKCHFVAGLHRVRLPS